jgi:branched-chain amino acid transport system ATP-binding protein
MSAHLQARGVKVHFEGVKAVDGVDLHLAKGEILGLIGPNGAGKTTVVNALTGFAALTEGTVELAGDDVTGWSAHKLARAGLLRTFQNVRLFPKLTVLENVEVGGCGVGISRREARRQAADLLDDFGLGHRGSSRAHGLPHGEERRVGILRALASRPAVLLLDEPAAGLNEAESDELVATLRHARERFGCGLMVIEHDMRVIMSLCERVHVLDYGRTLSVGTPDEIRADAAVVTAYLGTRKER